MFVLLQPPHKSKINVVSVNKTISNKKYLKQLYIINLESLQHNVLFINGKDMR